VTEQQVPAGVALRVELLPASFGDCVLVSAPNGGSTYRLLVDTGPDRASLRALRERLEQIPLAAGTRRIDLLIVTHIDHDHIGNVDALLNDSDLRLQFDDIWFNGHEQLREFAQRGTVEADAVSATIARRSLPLNRAFGGGPVVVPSESATSWHAVAAAKGKPTLTLLSPGATQLGALVPEWDDALRRLAAGEPDSDAELGDRHDRGPTTRPRIDLTALAAEPFEGDSSAPNASSIAVLVEYRGASILLAADAFPEVYGAPLAALLASRGRGRTAIDAVKLAHHGSRRNTEATLALTRAKHYLVSSNNARYGHPDDQTLARLIVNARPSAAPTFWFNYGTALNLRWAEQAERLGSFRTRYPDEPGGGIVLDLPVRRRTPARR
jgi:beta-lactamase superfamily II metal-dependent hydrolase